ncbi:GNAT family N-acetyltransferase [Streptomyces sp. NRRL S-340]|uniref:GNAT family N-acetyltransferase n=1 Tax=Streptomyces sp. NRRL S-340 TaxID=1463901 RepID=UPI003B640593
MGQPQARGCGVGDRLTAAVEGWAGQRGATTLQLAVLPGDEPAIVPYQRHRPARGTPRGRCRSLRGRPRLGGAPSPPGAAYRAPGCSAR